jgi:hypothetical protein
MADALGMTTSEQDARMDVVPVDYAAGALRHLLLKPRLLHEAYHIAAGEESCCTWREIAAAFAATRAGVRHLATAGGGDETEPAPAYRTVDFEEIAALRPEFDRIFGPCNKKFMLGAARLYAGFAELDVVFDSRRLRSEGMPASPRFTDYLPICQRTSASRSIADQGMIDFA